MEDSDDNDNLSCYDDDEVFDDDNDVFDLEDAEGSPVPIEIEYKVITNDEILQLMDEQVSAVMHCLSSSRNTASTVLRHNNWKSSKLEDDWFSGDESIQTMVHHLQTPPKPAPKHETSRCEICFSKSVSKLQSMSTSSCGEHYYCNKCWSKYISVAIEDGPSCLALRCPDPSCKAPVPDDMIVKLTTKATVKMFNLHRLRTFVQNCRKIRWCPAPGCEYAVISDSGGSGAKVDVNCKCGHEFCFRCVEEVHRPVDCKTMEKWTLKNSSESESVNWIIAYTKPCPSCKKPIEKNQGCMSMMCRCGQRFCWLCLKPGGYGCGCNRYMPYVLRQDSKDDANERNLKRARQYIEKYTHYYTRWAENGVSTAKARAFLLNLESGTLNRIRETQEQTASQMEAIIEAWQQIVVSRRFLRWSYVYGYYMGEDEQAKNLFEHHQGLAEKAIEWLHKCAEKDLKVFIDSREGMKDAFREYRCNLVRLTDIARKYTSSFIEDLEKGKY